MSDRLDDVLAVEPLDAGDFRARIPDGWQQGRGAFGGLVLGLLARAMEQTADDATRPLRTLSGEIVAPVLPGEARLRVFPMREGTGTKSLRAELVQEGEVRAHGHALFGKTRVRDRDQVMLQGPPPAARDWESVDVLPVEPPLGPAFGQHFEFRPTGPWPFSGSEPVAEGFVRARLPPQAFTAAHVIAHVDAWWPTMLAQEQGPRPMATVSFSVQLCAEPSALPADKPFFHRSRLLAAHDGYFLELRELWTCEGLLVALNPQTFAILK